MWCWCMCVPQRGGRTTYFGPLGHESSLLVAYLQAVPGGAAVEGHLHTHILCKSAAHCMYSPDTERSHGV